jgi:hypothetical protein
MYTLTNSNAVIRNADNTYIPFDPANSDYQGFLEWQAKGNTPVPVDTPSQEELIAKNITAIQKELDRQSSIRGYDNIISACSYAAQPEGAPFQAEGVAFQAWRSAVWAQAYAYLDQVNQGQSTLPSPQEAVEMMPVLVLP